MKINVISIEDKNNFSKIYIQYFEKLCRYAYRFLQDKDLAAEVVQEVMAKLWEKRELMVDVTSIESYLYKSVYNSCVNKFEHMKVHNKYVTQTRLQLMEIELSSFEESHYQWDIKEQITTEIEKLHPKCKAVFELRYYECMKYKEIATQLDISERTVESHIQIAIKTLRNKLKKLL